MTKTKFSHKVIAIFMTINFLQSFIPYNMLLANNNGPSAPEAAAFEPVDATDMVNLLTGDFTYVLPLLNVPSPEGGYPLALSYHAGIGMDQQASWVGLGWSLNPGSITRGVNGYPDDWASGKILERYYDVGGSETSTTVTASYNSYSGQFISTSLSHNSNRGWGGSVTYGVGFLTGDGSVGLSKTIGVQPGGKFFTSSGVGYNSASGFSVGGSIGTQGFSAGAGYGSLIGNSSTGVGSGVGYSRSWQGNDSFSVSFGITDVLKQSAVGISFSTSGGASLSVGSVGLGANMSFTQSLSVNDYDIKEKNFNFSLPIPTPVGIFGIGYNRHKIKWSLNSEKESFVSSALYLNQSKKFRCVINGFRHSPPRYGGSNSFYMVEFVDNVEDCDCQNFDLPSDVTHCGTYVVVDPYSNKNSYMDIYEIGKDHEIQSLSYNNAVFPAYDNFNVTAQGISGSITPYLFQSGSLNGIGQTEFSDIRGDYSLTYSYPFPDDWQTAYTDFSRDVNFHFNNEHGTSLTINPVQFQNNSNATKIFDYLDPSSNNQVVGRKRGGNFVSYFTNGDIDTGNHPGLMLPDERNIPSNSGEAIGAYKIATTDGKTYHYSLPVYNHESVTRTIGADKPERESYFESQQLKPYATHWLLTAITGPDYIDVNQNNKADENDLGYWVDFQYGQWSDAFMWKSPYLDDYEENEISGVKTVTHGRKQLFYLDKIKTRTHTALFIKDIREDNQSEEWAYHAVEKGAFPSASTFDTPRFVIGQQKSLKLDKIILVKNIDDNIDKTSGSGLIAEGSVNINYPEEKSEIAFYHTQDQVIDVNDNLTNIEEKSLKVIDFGKHYSNQLAQGSQPDTQEGKLTLNGISITGKENKQLIPPYLFYYYNPSIFNTDYRDEWGYFKNNSHAWSLNKIKNPTGSEIEIHYEPDSYGKLAVKNGRPFQSKLKFTFLIEPPKGYGDQLQDILNAPKGMTRIKIEVDENDPYAYGLKLVDYFDPSEKFYMDMWYSAVYNHSGSGYDRSAVNIDSEFADIVELNTAQNYMIVDVMASSPSFRDVFQHNAEPVSVKNASNGYLNVENLNLPRYELAWTPNQGWRKYSLNHTIIGNKDNFTESGIRVKRITLKSTTGGIYSTVYEYNNPDTNESSGVISYFPYKENSSVVIPYAAELPPPIPMYEYVTIKNIKGENPATNDFLSKNIYQFKVLDEKDETNLQFGDYFKINSSEIFNTTNSSANANINAKEIIVENNLASLGQVINILSYNNDGQVLSKTSHTYVNKNEINSGIIKESFQTYKIVKRSSSLKDEWLLNSSSKITYPSVLKSTTVTQNGFSSTTYLEGFDENTGQPLQTRTSNSKGQEIKKEIIPAYKRYPGMGSKVDDPTNKNMLTQEAVSYSYLKDNNEWKITGVGVQTWKDWGNSIWRKHKHFTWDGNIDDDGFYTSYTKSATNDDGFNWASTTVEDHGEWKFLSEISQYNNFSAPLEVTDINKNKASTKYDSKHEKVLVTSNASYNATFYSGAEDILVSGNFGGNVNKGSGSSLSNLAHTGKNSLQISSGQEAFKVVPGTTDNYKISVWVYGNSYTNARLNNNEVDVQYNPDEIITAGDWNQLNFYAEVNAGTSIYIKTISGKITVDDFRMHPVSSSMTAYVYNEWDELECIIGANNMATKYKYDASGRLESVYQEIQDTPNLPGGFKKVSEHNYNYKISQ